MSQLAIDMIRRDGGTQMRVSINEDAVDSYAERMEAGDIFPPVIVFYDGAAHWLADGFHRVEARCRAAVKHVGTDRHAAWASIDTDQRAGTRHDAIRFAIAANRTNGLRRTNADKQIAVRAAISHPDMQGMSDRAIAAEAGVSQEMVRQHRQLTTVVTSSQPSKILTKTDAAVANKLGTRTGVDGKSYPVKQKNKAESRPQQKQVERTRDASRVAVEQVMPTGDARKHICPTCNGKGFIE